MDATPVDLNATTHGSDLADQNQEKPPEYTLDGKLLPTTPMLNDRYARPVLVVPEYMKIPRGLHSSVSLEEPPYLESGWTTYVNPEGSPYYVNHTKHIVTDDPIRREEICKKITSWQQQLEVHVNVEGLQMPEDYEYYITVDPKSDRCKYYFVDHTAQVVFWLEEIDPERHDSLNLPLVCSPSVMKYVLQEQYWCHCEYFPHHPVPLASRRELAAIFRQARLDQLTSDTSTFPYTAEQCKQFLQVIDDDSRLWAAMARHRYTTFYGEDFAKLDRDKRRYDNTDPERTVLIKMCTALLFNFPKETAKELDKLISDDVTYGIHWREFADGLLREWREISTISLSRPTNPVSQCLGSITVVVSLAGTIFSSVLLQWYKDADKFHANRAVNHLHLIKSETYGYEPTAQAYSAPRALMFWAAIFLALHMLTAVADLVGLIFHAPALLLAIIILVSFWHMHTTLHDAFTLPPREQHLQW
ncbi:hypothetical protein C8Q74DRAFT_1400073 [Fomes fomentarius]|nr:hypothetical protein C8Q74DRAFT_1400073 [Fomes fomentarius]